MIVENIYRGRTLRTITIGNVTTESDEEILELALATAGETRGRLTDLRVQRYPATPGRVNAFLYTD